MEKQKLLELDLDTDAVVQKSSELRNQMQSLKASIDDLKKSEEDQTENIIKAEAAYKKLSAEYNTNQKVLQALVTANGKAIPVSEKVNLLLEKEISTRAEAKSSITEITKLRDQLNPKIADEAALMDKLNKKLDENNNFLKDTGSQREKQIMNIGNYKESVVQAIQETGAWSNELLAANQVISAFSLPFQELRNDLSSSIDLMRNSAKSTEGMTVAQKGLTIATNVGTGAMRVFALALAALGIGLIIAAVVLLIGYLKSFTPIVDKAEQVFAGFGAVVKVVQRTLLDFIRGLSDLEGTMKKVAKFFSDPIGTIRDFGNELSEAASKAAELKKAQQDLEDALESQEITSAKLRAEINKLNIQAKDRTRTEEERLALLQRAEKLEIDEFNMRKKNAQEQLRIAQQQIINEAGLTEAEANELRKRGFAYKEYVEQKANNTDELFTNLKDALLKETEIENEFYSNLEKNINRQNALIEKAEAEAEARRKQAEENRKKALTQASALAKAELDLLISNQGFRVKSLEDEIKLAEEVKNQRLKIAQAEFNASEKTKADELKLLTEQNNIRNEFLEKQANAVVEFANRELNSFIEANQSKIDAQRFFSEAILQEEERRLQSILEQQLNFERIKLEQGVTSEFEYQQAIKAIQDDFQNQKDQAQEARRIAEEERKAIDLENQRAFEDLVFQDNLAIELGRLEQRRNEEVANAEKTGASIDLINRKYAAAKQKLERESAIAQISNAQMAIGQIGELAQTFFGENRLLSAAIATVDMYLAIQKAYLSQLTLDPTSPARAVVAAAAAGAFGLRNVIKISGVKLASGGMVLGPGTGTSDSIPAMLSNGESVINAKSTSMFAPLLSLINQIGGGRAFASGGMATVSNISRAVQSSSARVQLFDYDMLVDKLSSAYASLPQPVLPVEAFYIESNKYVEVTSGANH